MSKKDYDLFIKMIRFENVTIPCGKEVKEKDVRCGSTVHREHFINEKKIEFDYVYKCTICSYMETLENLLFKFGKEKLTYDIS